jgi:hypothetical protein
VIIMDDAAKHVPPLGCPVARRTGERDWTLLSSSLMGSPLIIKGDIFCQHASQVALVQDEQVVHALLARRSDPSFGNAVGLRLPRRRPHDRQSFALENPIEARRELPIPIVQKDTGGKGAILDRPAHVSRLLRDPGGGRVLGATGKEHLPCAPQ